MGDGADFQTARGALSGRTLLVARLVWVAVAVLALGVGMAAFLQSEPFAICTEAKCELGDLTPDQLQELEDKGLSRGLLETYIQGFVVIGGLVWLGTGALVFWRKSDDGMGLFVSGTLVLFGSFLVVAGPVEDDTVLGQTSEFLGLVSFGLLVALFLTFPDGRFVPRWTVALPVPVAVTMIVLEVLGLSFQGGSESVLVDVVLFFLYGSAFGIPVFAQVYRYRRISNSIQRQQTKWVVVGIGAVLVGVPGSLRRTRRTKHSIPVVCSTDNKHVPGDGARLCRGLDSALSSLGHRRPDQPGACLRPSDRDAGVDLLRRRRGPAGGVSGGYRAGVQPCACGLDAGHRCALPAGATAVAGHHRPPLLPPQVRRGADPGRVCGHRQGRGGP